MLTLFVLRLILHLGLAKLYYRNYGPLDGQRVAAGSGQKHFRTYDIRSSGIERH